MITPSPADTAALLGFKHAIMWCDQTSNYGVYGCAMLSPACGTADGSSMCYASVTAERLIRFAEGAGRTSPYAGLVRNNKWTGKVRVDPARVRVAFDAMPKRPRADGRQWRIFGSMFDLFHRDVPFEYIDLVFAEAEAHPHIALQVLTKRADRMAEYAADRKRRTNPDLVPERRLLRTVWPANVWAGVTVEDQRRADDRIPHLLAVPAAVRFLSVEPMLGAIDVSRYLPRITGPWGTRAPATWAEVTWPEWVPADIRKSIESFWGDSYGRSPVHYARSASYGSGGSDDPAAFGATASPRRIEQEQRPIEGRYVHCWNNVGCIVDADGRTHTVSTDTGRLGRAGCVRDAIDWCIIGSESDGNRPGKRATDPAWVLDLVSQCDEAGTAVFVKQLDIDGKLCTLPMIDGRVRAGFPVAA